MFKARPIEAELIVGSGGIVVANDLRDFYPEGSIDQQGSTGALWQKEISEAFGKVGLFHGYVGNSCPGIWNYNGILIIGNDGYDDGAMVEVGGMPGKHIGSICTDLWWYSVADYDDYIKRGGKIDRHVDIIEAKPGRHILRHYYPNFGKSGIKCGFAKIFATIHRSNKALKSWRLPEEDIAEMLMARPEISYACVYHAEKKPIFSEYKIMVHWEANLDHHHIEDVFTDVYLTGEEIAQPSLVLDRALETYRKKAIEQANHEKMMKEHYKRLADMSPEERAELKEKLRKVTKDILGD